MRSKTLILSLIAIALIGTAAYALPLTPRPEPQAATGASTAATKAAASQAAIPHQSAQPHVTLTFTFTRANHYSSNQYAAWVENDQGRLVKQLVITRFAASPQALQRPDSLPYWTKHIKPQLPQSALDGVTSATPADGVQTYTWDLTDQTGAAVPDGSYTFHLAGTQNRGQQLEWQACLTVQSGTVTIVSPLSTTSETQETPIIQDPVLS